MQEPINLDGMTRDELLVFAADESNHELLRGYALRKATAWRLRMHGRVSSARYYEDQCEAIYEHLPDSLRW